ncbi:MAG TPA: lasso peptide biosynthesis B2 protein [Steroidobacteraceae bacterium]
MLAAISTADTSGAGTSDPGACVCCRYYLSDRAFTCRAGRSWYVLDLTHDSYLRLDRSAFEAMLPLIHGGEALRNICAEVSADESVAALELALQLQSRGILTNTAVNVHTPRQAATALPARSIVTCASRGLAGRLTAIPRFLRACRRASRALAECTLLENFCRLRARKWAHTGLPAFDLAKAQRLALRFIKLRPLYPRDYLCLFDSLALLEFLALHGLCPDFVFGVTDDPFQAHCWVQHADCALNESVEVTSLYTPIMVI